MTDPRTPSGTPDPWTPPETAAPHDPWAAPGTPPTTAWPATPPPAPPQLGPPPAYGPPSGYGPPPGPAPSPNGPYGGEAPSPYGTPQGYVPDDGYPPPPAPSRAFWPTDTGWMGFDPAKPPPRWGMPDIILGMLAFLVGGFVFALPLAFLTGDIAYVVIPSLLGSWAGAVGYLLLISRRKGQGSFKRDFGFAFTWWDPLIGMGAGFVTLIVAGIVGAIIAVTLGDGERASNAGDIFGPVADNRPLLVVMALLASFGAPVVEELLFRGLALRAIERRLGGVVAVIGSSLLFSVLHLQGLTTVAAGVGLVAVIGIYGLSLAILTRWSGRLGPAICTHLFINGLQCVILLATVFSGGDLNF